MSRKTLTKRVTCDKCGFSIIIDMTQLDDGIDRVTRHIKILGWTGKWKHEPATLWPWQHSYRVGDLCAACSEKNQT